MKINDLLTNNADECCVVCLSRKKNMSSIYENRSDSIVDKIAFATGVLFAEHPNMPSQICKMCNKILAVAHKFKTQCLVAENTFREFLESRIKTEDATEYETFKEYDDMDDYNDDSKIDIKVEIDTNEVKNFDVANSISDETLNKQEQKNNPTNVRKTRKPYKKRAPPKPGKCEICCIRFDTERQTKEHRDYYHKSMNSLVCIICGKLSANKKEMYYHNRCHFASYQCAHCDYSTGLRSSLIKHIDVHMGVKNYRCQHCDKTYRTTSQRGAHIRRAHLKEFKYSCHICKKLFFTSTTLARHVDSHNNVKRHECSVCLSKFARRCRWKKHMQLKHSVVIGRIRPGKQTGATTQLARQQILNQDLPCDGNKLNVM